MNNLEKELNYIINWTRSYFSEANTKYAVIGISGGIDSAVTAAICKNALGKENVIGIKLPCLSQYTDEIDSLKICRHLDIQEYTMDLEDTFHKWWRDYRKNIARDLTVHNNFPDINNLLPANAKARFRMLTLYAVAGQIGGLVVGTTNKTEALLGYATKYGDGGVDIEPIMDFYKTEVFELAKLLELPKFVINKAPTAGLWLGQTDEKELGMTYEKIDEILMSDEKQWARHIDIEKDKKIYDLIAASKHKDINLPHYKRG